VVDLMLTFINSIQAIYHFSSLGTKVEFSISHLEIHKSPNQFNDHNGDRGPLLTSFCEYQGGQRPAEGKPGHWDIGLLVSGVGPQPCPTSPRSTSGRPTVPARSLT
jgi:hypothetical protein